MSLLLSIPGNRRHIFPFVRKFFERDVLLHLPTKKTHLAAERCLVELLRIQSHRFITSRPVTLFVSHVIVLSSYNHSYLDRSVVVQ
jgi:hypothetical protein